ncbi:MAG: glycosyltransferase [Nitrospira sp.]
MNDAIRVLHLIETGGPGGAERMLLGMTRHLDASFHSMVGLVKPGWLEAQVQARGLDHILIQGGAWGDIGRILQLARVVRASGIQVIHAHEFYMNVLGAAVSLLTGVPLISTVHGKNYYPEKRRRQLLYRWVASRASSVVTVSEDLKAFFCRVTGVAASGVTVIPNGIDTDIWSPVVSDAALRAGYGIPTNAMVVGAIGNLYPVKRHIDLVRALPLLKTACPNIHVVILGRGDQKANLEREADSLGVADRLHLVGFQENARRWMNVMDCYVMPSENEGMPLSLLEAMSAQLPVIVTAVGGIPEVVTHEESGWLLPAHQPEVLAKTIIHVLTNRLEAQAVAARGRARVETRFSADAMARGYGALYRQGLQRTGMIVS